MAGLRPADRPLKHLSRGMRGKAALMGALAYRPKLLILDERFSGLDALVLDDLVQGVLEWAENCSWIAAGRTGPRRP